MTSFKTALGQFLTGEIELAELEKALGDELRARPDAASQINTQLEQLYRSGRLPNQIFAVLKRQVLAGPQSSTEGGDAGRDERTRFRVADQQRPADAERTEFQAPRGSRTGDSSRQHSVQSSQSSGRQTSGSQSSSGSSANWSNPSQWTGGDDGEDAAAPDVGSIIASRFVLESRIGQGGMGVVYKARDLRQEEAQDRNPYVALKLMNEDFKRHPESLKALQREARKAQDLSHQNVVYVSSFDRDGRNVFMVMELLDGDPLDRLIKRHANRGLPFDKVLPLVEGLAAGLGHAHKRGIVHSDFKPSNAWVTRDGIPKIFDFGIARAAKLTGGDGEKTLFDAGTLGALTPAYASVEMLEGKDPDPRDDIYALACVTYELLTGTHPFKKRPADEAKKLGMKPARIKGLSSRQFKGLLRGLAFDREQRSATVEDFVESLRPRQIQRSAIVAAAMGVVVVAVVLGYLLPAYLDRLKLEDLSAVISSGDASRISTRLGDIESLDDKLKNELFGNPDVKTNFIEFFSQQVDSRLNPNQDQFDYAGAVKLIGDAERILPSLKDNVRMRDIENNAVNVLNTELNRAINAGVLIPEQGPRNAVAIIAAMQVIRPETKPLDLAPELLKAARNEAEQGNATLAVKLVDRGLALAPGDVSLTNLRDDLRTRMEAAQRQAQLARAEADVSAALPDLKSLAAFDTARPKLQALADLDPQNALLSETQTRLESALNAELQPLIGDRRYADADSLVQKYADLLPTDVAQSIREKVTSANSEYVGRIANLVAALRTAVDAGRLRAPAPNNAEAALAALIAANAPANAVTEARGTIANAYLLEATKARDAADWARARDLVQRGLQQQPEAGLAGQLQDELAAINNDEQIAKTQGEAARQRLAREERARELQALTKKFDDTIGQTQFTIADANSLVDVVKNAQAKGGSIPRGRERIVERILAQAESLGRANDYDGAVDFLKLGTALFPDAPTLKDGLDRIQQQRDVRLAQVREQQVAQANEHLAQLLAAPDFQSAKWGNAVKSEQNKLEQALGANDPANVANRHKIAALYLGEANAQLTQKRLSNARALLDRAQGYAPQLEGLAQSRASLERATVAQREVDAQAQQQAKIDRLKRSVSAKAGAKDVGGAEQVFAQLKALLPANDPFVVNDGPQQIAKACEALALDAASNGRLDVAQQLVAKAKSWVPSYRPPQQLMDLIAQAQPKAQPKAAQATDPCARSALVGNGANERAFCRDRLADGQNGPVLVVVPAGGPLSKPIAIGKFEITVREYNSYCRVSKACQPQSVTDDTVPVTDISVQDAEKFAKWLSSESTGRYRLPTSAEWEWAAKADGGAQKGDLNCLVGDPGNPSKGAWLRGVKSGQPNGWGLYNSVGNAREWATDGKGLLALGGARTDRMNDCRPGLAVSHSGAADDVTGFRVVREIGG